MRTSITVVITLVLIIMTLAGVVGVTSIVLDDGEQDSVGIVKTFTGCIGAVLVDENAECQIFEQPESGDENG